MKLKTTLLSLILTLCMALIPAFAAGTYVHDPMANPKAAQDIVADPSAVYGYRPSPDSVRLKEFAGYDWTDPVLVGEMREQRIAYHESFAELYQMINPMKTEGRSVEEIARAVSTRRNELRLESYRDNPEELEKTKKSNLDTFGDENGGSPDYFYAKYGSWETVIEKALSTNAGADAVLGLYDMYYDSYFFTPGEADTPGETDPSRASDATLPAGSTASAASQNPSRTSDAALPAGGTASAASRDTYTVRPGDSLRRIAGKELGSPAAWRQIYSLNRDRIADPDLIFPGQVLQLRAAGQ